MLILNSCSYAYTEQLQLCLYWTVAAMLILNSCSYAYTEQLQLCLYLPHVVQEMWILFYFVISVSLFLLVIIHSMAFNLHTP